jgi:alpha-ketoglutarate-dependent taurine dioxygenase
MTIGEVEPERVNVGEPGAASRLVRALSHAGFALLDGVLDAGTLLRVARSIATIVPHRDSRPDGVTVLTNRGPVSERRGFAGFSPKELMPHTDRSGVAHPPALLMMACDQPAHTGGECIMVDGAAVYTDLAENEPEAVQALSTPRSALFGGAAGYLGSVFTPESNGRITVRLRLDNLARFSPQATRWLPQLRATIDRHAVTVQLRITQGYVLDNRRWLHGRRAFIGNRVLYRVTANPLPRLAIPSGFPLTCLLRSAVTA